VIFYPLLATVISAAFAATLWRQYRRRPRAYLAAWAVALAIYAVAALTEVIGAASGWNPLLYRTYYFFGGITVVGVLALGTVYLLAPRFGRLALWLLVVLAAIGLAGIVGATLQTGLLDTHQVPSVDTIRLEHGSFNVVAILMAAVLNIVGSVILIGGALWSAYGAWRRGGAQSRLVANILIAGGAFIVAGASTLFRVFHVYELFYVGQAIGVLVMFGGFLAAQRAPRPASNLNPVGSS
jgi:N-terminal 7TM region of histidine kinase